jgi:hypothetical protein
MVLLVRCIHSGMIAGAAASVFAIVPFDWEGTVQTRSPLGNLIFFTGLGALLGLGLGVIASLFSLAFDRGKGKPPCTPPPDGS